MLLSIYNPSFLGELNLHDVGVDLKWEELNIQLAIKLAIKLANLIFLWGQSRYFCGVNQIFFVGLKLNLFVALTSPGLRIPLGKEGWCRKSGKF